MRRAVWAVLGGCLLWAGMARAEIDLRAYIAFLGRAAGDHDTTIGHRAMLAALLEGCTAMAMAASQP